MTDQNKSVNARYVILFSLLIALIAAIITLVAVVIASQNHNAALSHQNSSVASDDFSAGEPSQPDSSATDNVSSSNPSTFVTPTGVTLDADFSRLLLTNANNPLPNDYDITVREHLVEIESQYRNNNIVTQIHKDVYPYITAMVAAAQADGVDLRVWSPFRSYAIQEDLFRKQVERAGGNEVEAATVVARPGTSEHNTGLCADFNMASDTFEGTPMFAWMKENAENYGFIMRYPADKQDITGVIYESWHWRFVGINAAKEINSLGLTLEEYIEYKNLEPTVDMYSDDK